MAASLALLQLDSSRRGERASGEGSRLAILLYRDISNSTLDGQFDVDALRREVTLATTALVRRVVAPDDAAQSAISRAETAAAARLGSADTKATGLSSGAQGIAEAQAQLLQAKVRWDRTIARQNAEIDDSSRYGRRSGRAVFGLALVAMAGALLGLAGVLRSGVPGRIVLVTGASSLALAVASGVSALFL